jgi:hypothetical protein
MGSKRIIRPIRIMALAAVAITLSACSSSPRASTASSSTAMTSTTAVPASPQSQPYRDGYTVGSTWTKAAFQWEGNVADTCQFELTALPTSYPTDNAADSAQWDDGCVAGLKSNPNRP